MRKGKKSGFVDNTIRMSSETSTSGDASGTSDTKGISIALLSDIVKSNWIVDTRASNHIMHNINLLKKLKEIMYRDISSVKVSMKVLGIGREEDGLYTPKADKENNSRQTGFTDTKKTPGQHMHATKFSHMEATMRVVRYIKGTTGLGMFMPVVGKKKLNAYL
ncbi:hypothetical protein HAX54_005539 [Datura stramonium]|uniref:Uncharacterized protein n=1 Tax=Datura stramonium TaxID=4076 RepID=A0ABS8TAD3_DATST|nr:hypothetical protein [Datura stramonium]